MKLQVALTNILFLGQAGGLSITMAQPRGNFAATGDMTTTRLGHTATLLTNGNVLIAGGDGGRGVLASAELYEPVSGKFTATGNMSTARRGHSASLLADGRVLISGGLVRCCPPLFTSSAELYDPSTGIFTATGDMITAHHGPGVLFGHTATVLSNGKVLIAGGGPAELYDPATGTFAVTGTYAGEYAPNPPVLYAYASTLLADGRVLLSGSTGFEARKELYDPASARFSVISTSGCDSTTATLLANGKVLLAGTYYLDCPSSAAELFDPSTGTITYIGNMTTSRSSPTATLIPDGTVLIAGGDDFNPAELYDPATGRFSPIGNTNLSLPRFWHTATLLAAGRVLIAGGHNGYSPTASAELYEPASLTPAPVLFSLPGDGRGQGAVLHAGTALVASSSNPAGVGEALEIYGIGLVDGGLIPPYMAEVLYFGKAPGFAGLNYFNARVPSGVALGPARPGALDLPRSSEQRRNDPRAVTLSRPPERD